MHFPRRNLLLALATGPTLLVVVVVTPTLWLRLQQWWQRLRLRVSILFMRRLLAIDPNPSDAFELVRQVTGSQVHISAPVDNRQLSTVRAQPENQALPLEYPERSGREGQAITELGSVDMSAPRVTRYMRKLVAEAKLEFPFMTTRRTPANYLAVNKFLQRAMEQHGLRRSHIAHFLPVVVELVFLPSDGDLLAIDVANSVEARDARVRATAQYVDWWWQRFLPTGLDRTVGTFDQI